LHDRGDYKSGWQLEREWEEIQSRKKKKLEESIKNFGDEFEDRQGKGTLKPMEMHVSACLQSN
jgi:RING finger protein 113A